MQDQAKSMKANWSYDCGIGNPGNFKRANKWSADGKYLKTLIVSVVAEDINLKKSNRNPKDDSYSDSEPGNFNFDKLEIGKESNLEWDHGHQE